MYITNLNFTTNLMTDLKVTKKKIFKRIKKYHSISEKKVKDKRQQMSTTLIKVVLPEAFLYCFEKKLFGIWKNNLIHFIELVLSNSNLFLSISWSC